MAAHGPPPRRVTDRRLHPRVLRRTPDRRHPQGDPRARRGQPVPPSARPRARGPLALRVLRTDPLADPQERRPGPCHGFEDPAVDFGAQPLCPGGERSGLHAQLQALDARRGRGHRHGLRPCHSGARFGRCPEHHLLARPRRFTPYLRLPCGVPFRRRPRAAAHGLHRRPCHLDDQRRREGNDVRERRREEAAVPPPRPRRPAQVFRPARCAVQAAFDGPPPARQGGLLRERELAVRRRVPIRLPGRLRPLGQPGCAARRLRCGQHRGGDPLHAGWPRGAGADPYRDPRRFRPA